MLQKLLVVIALFGLAGCASMSGAPVQTWKVGGVPGDDNVHNISAGEVLYSKFKYATSPVAKVTAARINVGLGNDILVDKPLVLTKMKNTQGYCGVCQIYVPLSPPSPAYACFFDDDKDGVFEDVMWGGSRIGLNDKTKYAKVDQSVTNVDGFKREILFQGRTEKTLKFKYREFMNDMARPAFAQDIEYFISKNGTTAGNFKGLKIEVLSVEGNYIKYRVQGDIDNQ